MNTQKICLLGDFVLYTKKHLALFSASGHNISNSHYSVVNCCITVVCAGELQKNMTRKQRRRLEAEREDAEDMQDEDNSQQDDDQVTRFPFMFFSQELPRQFHHNVGCDQ